MDHATSEDAGCLNVVGGTGGAGTPDDGEADHLQLEATTQEHRGVDTAGVGQPADEGTVEMRIAGQMHTRAETLTVEEEPLDAALGVGQSITLVILHSSCRL